MIQYNLVPGKGKRVPAFLGVVERIDMQSLKKSTWITGFVLDAWSALLLRRSRKLQAPGRPSPPKVHFMPFSFFSILDTEVQYNDGNMCSDHDTFPNKCLYDCAITPSLPLHVAEWYYHCLTLPQSISSQYRLRRRPVNCD